MLMKFTPARAKLAEKASTLILNEYNWIRDAVRTNSGNQNTQLKENMTFNISIDFYYSLLIVSRIFALVGLSKNT
jgi:hypothetical protein